jgi:hypothetical protein
MEYSPIVIFLQIADSEMPGEGTESVRVVVWAAAIFLL